MLQQSRQQRRRYARYSPITAPLFINAYLEPWSAFTSPETLRQTFLEARPFGFVALIAGQARLKRQQGMTDLRLWRSLIPYYMRQLAMFTRSS